MVIRTWNVFHGNAVPPRRDAHLEQIVRLASVDRPDVLCLQELPAWSLRRLEGWSGMSAVGDVASRPPLAAEAGRVLTDLHHGLLRSAVSGQANAVLWQPSLRLLDRSVIVLNPRRVRRAHAGRLGLPLRARLAWARERRICQAVRLGLPDGRALAVANLHATSYARDRRLAAREVLRAAVLLDSVAEPADVAALVGDFNVGPGSPVFAELATWGFSGPGPGVDHVLVRGADASPHERWPDERRRLDGLLLSDHAPLEVRVR